MESHEYCLKLYGYSSPLLSRVTLFVCNKVDLAEEDIVFDSDDLHRFSSYYFKILFGIHFCDSSCGTRYVQCMCRDYEWTFQISNLKSFCSERTAQEY